MDISRDVGDEHMRREITQMLRSQELESVTKWIFPINLFFMKKQLENFSTSFIKSLIEYEKVQKSF